MGGVANQKSIGVLAVQGAFAEHIAAIKCCGADAVEIREPKDLSRRMDGLILPGGESTVQAKLLQELGLFSLLSERIEAGLPVYGTCAGLILLAKSIEGEHLQNFGCMDMTAVRNAYGRQLGSFITTSDFAGQPFPMVFIRAPYMKRAGPNVEVLSQVSGRLVAARERNMLVTAFHPELTSDRRIHQYFLEMVSDF